MTSVSFWFNFYPGALSPLAAKLLSLAVIFFIIGAFVLGSLVKRRLHKAYWRPIWQHFYYLFITNSIVGVFVWFFMYEAVPFFSARFWFLLWALVNLIWFYFIGRAFWRLPQRKREYEKIREFKKYLP